MKHPPRVAGVYGWACKIQPPILKKGAPLPTDFEKGYLVGLLVGEGHFGGDGRQPQVTLRMHVRHEALFYWIERTFPGGRLYGPYNHDGRHYFQWMARGSFLRDVLMPILDEYLTMQLDAASAERFDEMKARYHRRLGLLAPAAHADEHEGEKEQEVSPRALELEEQGGTAHLSGEHPTAAEIFDRLRREPRL